VGSVTYYAEARNETTNCTSSTRTPVVLTINDAPDIPIITGNSTYCYNDGAVTLDAGAGYASYLWSPGGETTQTIIATGGNYTVTVTNGPGCEATSEVFVVETPRELICNVTSTNVTYNGGSDGTATVNPVGGTAPYIYEWDNGDITQTITGLFPGTYSVIVTDANGCDTTCEVLIEQPELTLACEIVLNNHVLCRGESTGSATVVPTGGVAPYTYEWDNGETTATAYALNAGVHRVTITDANGSKTSCSYCIVEPEQLLCNVALIQEASSTTSYDGSATVNVTGGTLGYSYLWDNGEITATATGLNAGAHSVWVTDANGCMTDCSVYVTAQPELVCSVELVSSVVCSGESSGSAIVTPSGGNGNYSYLWDNGETTAMAVGLSAGVHRVTVTDSNGNTTSCSICITEPKELFCNVSLEHGSSGGDNNGKATVSVTGGVGTYSYLWENGETTATALALAPGIRSVTVTDANGCQTSCSVNVPVELRDLTCSIEQVKQITCNKGSDGSAKVSATGGSGGYTYLWDNGETAATAVALTAGVHTVTVTDSYGNSTSCTICLGEPDPLNASVALERGVSANGSTDGSATVTVSGGVGPFSYFWDNNETTVTAYNLSAGEHSVLITDNQGCETWSQITVSEPGELGCGILEVESIDCYGGNTGALMLTVAGGTGIYDFMWSNGMTTQTVSALTAGEYTVTITDSAGTTGEFSYTLGQPDAFTASIDVISNVTTIGGNDGSATALPSGGDGPYSYQWSNGTTTSSVDGLSAADYTVLVTDSNGCATTADVVINEPETEGSVVVEEEPIEEESLTTEEVVIEEEEEESIATVEIIETDGSVDQMEEPELAIDNTVVKPYPLTFVNELNLNIKIKYDAKLNIRMYDMNGRTVLQDDSRFVKKGSNVLRFNVSRLAPDVYIMIINTGSEQIVKKVMSKK